MFSQTHDAKKPARRGGCAGLFGIKSRRRPTLPHSCPCSTIGPEGLNFRVRDGNGCDPLGIATEKLFVRSEVWEVRSKSFCFYIFRLASYVSPIFISAIA